jgi:hypothetical protein
LIAQDETLSQPAGSVKRYLLEKPAERTPEKPGTPTYYAGSQEEKKATHQNNRGAGSYFVVKSQKSSILWVFEVIGHHLGLAHS